MDLDSMDVENVWQKIETIAHEQADTIRSVDGSFQFYIKTKDDEEAYFLRLEDGNLFVTKGSDTAQCTLSMNEKNFKKLLVGDLQATTAFMTGRLKVKGDISLALRLENMLKKLQWQ